MQTPDGRPEHGFETMDAFEAWLAQHHADSDGIWIRMARKGTGLPSITWKEIVEVALCYGWIDGQSRRIDDRFFWQKVTPRRPRSTWSKTNREKVAALVEAGRMRAPGLAEIERAKADGRWDAAYDGPGTATVPAELQAALAASPQAAAAFEALDAQNRYAMIHRIQTARRPETRERHAAKFAAMLERGEKIHP
jgi:uncharacterized protein YdeI (YjbR/CyaY-like superfamily)